TDERLWTDDRDDLQDRRKPSIQLDKEQAIAVRKPDASVDYPAQHNNLVPERGIFGFKSALRLEWRDQDVKDKTWQRDHCAPTLGDSLPQSIRIRFSVHTRAQPKQRSQLRLNWLSGLDSWCLLPVYATTRRILDRANEACDLAATITKIRNSNPLCAYEPQRIIVNKKAPTSGAFWVGTGRR